MYMWSLTIGMKNGQILKCLWESKESGSLDVVKEIIPEKMPSNYFVTTSSENGKSQITFRVEDISTLKVALFGEEKKE